MCGRALRVVVFRRLRLAAAERRMPARKSVRVLHGADFAVSPDFVRRIANSEKRCACDARRAAGCGCAASVGNGGRLGGCCAPGRACRACGGRRSAFAGKPPRGRIAAPDARHGAGGSGLRGAPQGLAGIADGHAHLPDPSSVSRSAFLWHLRHGAAARRRICRGDAYGASCAFTRRAAVAPACRTAACLCGGEAHSPAAVLQRLGRTRRGNGDLL